MTEQPEIVAKEPTPDDSCKCPTCGSRMHMSPGIRYSWPVCIPCKDREWAEYLSKLKQISAILTTSAACFVNSFIKSDCHEDQDST